MRAAWIQLIIAGLLETGWAVGMRYSQGFTRPAASAWTAVAMAGSVYLLARAVQSLPLGVGYTVWTGIGALGAVLYSAMFFNEPVTAFKAVCILLILAGIAGLGFAGGH